MTRFVLLSAARSGTSLVMRTLEKHPDVWVAGEIFHPSPKWHLPPELAIEERLRVRELDPIEFVEQVFSAGASKQAAGFKMWYDQNPSAADYVMARNDIKKIVLNRINKLATYSSGFAAEQTGIWNVPITDINTYVPPPLYFSESSFDQHVAHHSRLFDSYSDSMAGDVYGVVKTASYVFIRWNSSDAIQCSGYGAVTIMGAPLLLDSALTVVDRTSVLD
jgi:hypothetical protein